MTITTAVKDEKGNMPVLAEEVFSAVLSKQQDKLLCHQNQFAVFKPGVSFVPGCATDSDDPSTPNAELQYKILTQTPSQPSEHMFQMDSRTWAFSLSVEEMLLCAQVHYEKQICCVLDTGKQKGNVYGNRPILIRRSGNGSQVQWQSREVHYYLKGSSPQGFFSIDPARNIYATLELDRESQAEHEIQVLAGNRLLYSDPLMLLITVMDENDNLPVFTQEFYQIALKENTAKRSEIITVKAENINDPKTNDSKIDYEILSQEPQVSNGFSFHIVYLSMTGSPLLWRKGCFGLFLVSVTIYLCTKDRQFEEAAGRTEGKPTVISAVIGIIVGTIGTIGFLMLIIFVHLVFLGVNKNNS
ncbi:LOW QUALITY PROTEIN: cadherin-16 [Sarcoramphus papa]